MADPVRADIRFWFRGEVVSITGVSPQKTVLRWLREDRGATGTKEGCGEGDCGACTVAVGSLDLGAPQGLRLLAINSCLLFLPALDGKALFTVEDVAAGGDLHPVQRALVDLHASQCGFCTPGFVMSLWADYQERNGPPDRAAATSILSGNLCRCTGYRPLLDAARAAWDHPAVKLNRAPVAAALQGISQLPSLAYQHEGQSWQAPRSLERLADLAEANPEARIVAGATDVGLWVTKGLRDLGNLISISAVDELKTVTEGDGLILGAGLILTDAFRTLVERYPELSVLADRFASVPVRNAGTLGGNVANGSPIGDSMPVLLALGASVILRKGPRTRELPLDQFYVGYQKTLREPGELVAAVRIPAAPQGRVFRAWKISKRRDQDISAVCGAFSVSFDARQRIVDAKLAFGGMAAIPSRATGAEKAMLGRVFDQSTLSAAQDALEGDFTPLTDGRATADYRRVVARNLLTRFHAEISVPGVAS